MISLKDRLELIASTAETLARHAREALKSGDADPNELIPLAAAAKRAATSVRTVKDAIRSGDLAAYGGQRDRSVRVSDVDKWIDSRRMRPIMGPDDADIERRMKEIARRRKKKS